MQIEYPFFKIPQSNKVSERKRWGWSDPKNFVDSDQFEVFRNERLSNLNRVIDFVDKKPYSIKNTNNKVFIELDFHSKALSKSAQPTDLLDKFNIDIYSQKAAKTFVGSVDRKSLIQFRNAVSSYNLLQNPKESAYLSAITNIQSFKVEKDLINEGDELLVYFHQTLWERECKIIYKELKESCTLEDSQFFISNSGAKIIYSSFNRKLLDLISEDHPQNPIQKIEKNLHMSVSRWHKHDYDFSWIEIIAPELDSLVCIFDSWVENHKFLNWLVIDGWDFIWDSSLEDKLHWTLVWTRAIFWNDILSQLHENNKLFAQTRVIDVKMMKKDGITEMELVHIISHILEEHSQTCKVYNLSLNLESDDAHEFILHWKRHYITRELDSLAVKYSVLFVISAWNHGVYTTVPYPECLMHNEALITPPADMANWISVGSIADIESSISLASVNEPSPFTRIWLSQSVKPELCHYWWNIDKYNSFNGLGAKWFWIEINKIDEDFWTSFAAPLVSQVAWRIYAYLKETNMWWSSPPIELVKALLIHSARYQLPLNSTISKQDWLRMTGFWMPDFNRAVDWLQSEASFIYFDSINQTEVIANKAVNANKNKVRFDVPQELVWKNKEVKIRATLVYDTPISTSWDIDYSLSDIEINLHYYNSAWVFVSWNLTKWDIDSRSERAWIKQFEKTYTAYRWGGREVWLTLKMRGDIENTDFLQKYALVISIEDVSSWEKIHLHDIIKNQYTQYVPIVQNIKVRS